MKQVPSELAKHGASIRAQDRWQCRTNFRVRDPLVVLQLRSDTPSEEGLPAKTNLALRLAEFLAAGYVPGSENREDENFNKTGPNSTLS